MVNSGDISASDNVKHAVEGNVQQYSSLPLYPQCFFTAWCWFSEENKNLMDSSDSLGVFVLFPSANQIDSVL